MSQTGFLETKVASNDVIVVQIIDSPRPQVLNAKIERIYSVGKGVALNSLGKKIEFIRSPGHWGDMELKNGEKAILFVSKISGQLYEDPWRGHLVIEEIDQVPYAIYQHRALWLEESIPHEIKASAIQDPKRPFASAIPYAILEEYLQRLIKKIHPNQPTLI